MARNKSKDQERQVLELLKRVLPKTVPDPKLIEKIYSACEKEIQAKSRLSAFEEFCSRVELPDLEPKTITAVQQQFETAFGKGKVALLPHPAKQAASVEVVLPDETYEGTIKVNANAEEENPDGEAKPKFVPFPVCLETDTELVWMLARLENKSPAEAAVALTGIEEEFWETKTGQKLIRDRVERSFPEFISRVPSKMLAEGGLKRHYKEPEPLKPIKPSKLAARKKSES